MSPAALEAEYSFGDLLDAHDALDALEAVDALLRKRAQAEAARPKGFPRGR